MKQISALKQTTGQPLPQEEDNEEDEDVLSMMDNDELTFQELAEMVRQFQASEATNN